MIAELILAAALQTATVKNPRNVEFECQEHARDDQHELDIIRVSDGVVVQTILLGDPPAGSDGIVRATFNVQPIDFGTYKARVRVVAGGLRSVDSGDSNVFERAPGAPSSPIVK